ncbi:2242_t:CDS:2, partial [Diversispora eburnea]
QHYEQLREIFCGKPVSIIIDETTDKKAHSVINTFFSYQNQTKLISVDFISQVNNVTVGQLVLKTLVEWEISFTYSYLIVSDSAAYMKKSVREILQPVMSQIQHNTCCARIIQLISLNSQDTQQLTFRFMPLPNTTR